MGVGVVDVCSFGDVDGVLVEADVVDAAASFGADACDVGFGGVGEGDDRGEWVGEVVGEFEEVVGAGGGGVVGVEVVEGGGVDGGLEVAGKDDVGGVGGGVVLLVLVVDGCFWRRCRG